MCFEEFYSHFSKSGWIPGEFEVIPPTRAYLTKLLRLLQVLRELFITDRWFLNMKDQRQKRCVGSLQLATPQGELYLRTVSVESLREWLSHPEGPQLIDTHGGPDAESYRALAIGLDPQCLYDEEAEVGIGIVFKPPYVGTVSFGVAADHFNRWLGDTPNNKLSGPSLLFLSISLNSEIYPLCKRSPYLIDVSQKVMSEDVITGGTLTEFRGFLLPRVMAKEKPTSEDYVLCGSYPRLPGGKPLLINPVSQRVCDEAFTKDWICLPLQQPSPEHWSLQEDKIFDQWKTSLAHAREIGASNNAMNSESDKNKKGKSKSLNSSKTTPTVKEEKMDTDQPNPPEIPPSNEGASKTSGSSLLPDDSSISPEVLAQAREILEDLHGLHLHALFEMGSVRAVDRILAEMVMAHFARINLLLGEDLNVSLRELVTVTQEASKGLQRDIKLSLGDTAMKWCGAGVQVAIDKYHQRIDSAITKTLLFLDCGRREGRAFLRERVSEMESTTELQELSEALAERFNNHQSQIWKIVMGPGMSDPRVSTRVNAALSAVQPMVNNYFGGILEGLMGSLSLTAPPGDETARSTQEGVEQRIAEALKKSLPPEAVRGGDPPQGLHVGYKLDFFHRDSVPPVPALSSTALPDLLKAMDRLRLQVPPVPDEARSLLEGETLLDKINPGSKDSRSEEVEVHLMSDLLHTFERAPKVKGMKRCSALPNRAAKTESSAGTPGAGQVPPSQVDASGKDPSQPPTTGSHKRKIESLKADVFRRMSQMPQVVIGGVVIDHDQDSVLATLSVSKKRASNPVQNLDDEVEGQDEPARKVTKVTFASDDDLSSPLARSKPDASVSQQNGGKPDNDDDPDDEPTEVDGDDDEPTDIEGAKVGNQKDLEEDEEGSSDSDEEEEDDVLEEPKESLGSSEDPDLVTNRLQARINLYAGDKIVANRVRCSILDLRKDAEEPSRMEIEASPIFRLRGPKEGDKSISNIAVHWITILANSNILGNKHPNAFKPPEGWPKIYSWETFRAQAPEVASKLWRGRRTSPSIVVIIPPEESEFRKSYFLNRLHKIGSIKRVSVYYEDEKARKQRRKQYCFCGYCGVVSMNEDSGFSHMRKHLGVEFVCGGCLNYKDPIPKNMGLHMQVCTPCKVVRRACGLKDLVLPTKSSKQKKKGKSKKGGKKRTQ